MILRPYQIDSLYQIRQKYKRQKKVLLHLPTGSGKTVIFCQVLKGALEKGKRAIMVVRGRKLVDQASNRLFREGVPHGVLMSNHWNHRPHERIQVCSIDTLIARKLSPPADLVVIDEAHLFTSETSVNFFKKYPDAFMLPVTATPYTDKSLRHIAQEVVHPITMAELIEQGFLVGPRYFAPNIPDLTGVKTRNGDFVNEQLQEIMSEPKLVGDLVSHQQKLARRRPTLVFAVSVNHSKSIVESFNEKGIRAEHCDANSTDKERKAVISRLESGETKVVSNVGIFGIGADIPPVACVVMARPTKSYNLYIQQAGRGTRPDPTRNKTHFLLLDHAGNCLRHGFIEVEKEAELDGKDKRKVEKSVSPKVCKECFAIYQGSKCPSCGASGGESKPRQFEVIDGNLKEIKPKTAGQKIEEFIKEMKKTARAKGYKRGWVYWRVVDRYGYKTAEQYCPKPKLPDWVKRRYE